MSKLPSLADCDWTEDFEHENGNYLCHCSNCGGHFKGHKRRVICKLCAKPDADRLEIADGKYTVFRDANRHIMIQDNSPGGQMSHALVPAFVGALLDEVTALQKKLGEFPLTSAQVQGIMRFPEVLRALSTYHHHQADLFFSTGDVGEASKYNDAAAQRFAEQAKILEERYERGDG